MSVLFEEVSHLVWIINLLIMLSRQKPDKSYPVVLLANSIHRGIIFVFIINLDFVFLHAHSLFLTLPWLSPNSQASIPFS